MLSQIHINLNMEELERISNPKGPQTCAVNHERVIPMVPLRQMFDWKEFQRVILRSGPLGSLEFAFRSDWCWCGVSPHVLTFIYIYT